MEIMSKIKMKVPLVEMDGDEMTRVIWQLIKENLLQPYLELKTEYYDLGLEHRDQTEDRVTIDAARANKKYGVAVKCATITPNKQRMKEYKLKQAWKSPNGTIRAILDGTVFRTPIVVRRVAPLVRNWKKPITIARHAYGDLYENVEYRVDQPGKAELVFTAATGQTARQTIFEFEGPGMIMGMHNLDRSIASFARACFTYALKRKQNLWFSAKDTIARIYDQSFKNLFQDIFENEFRDKFAEAGIEYFYALIDDAAARLIRSQGGFIWACKNYDGDVMSDLVAAAFGGLAMMTSVLVSPSGCFQYEAAHGTVTRHYYRHLRGEATSTNSMATIFAWSGALRKRGAIDRLPELVHFAGALEKAALQTVETGTMTNDLALFSTPPGKKAVDTESFIMAVKQNLENIL